MVVDVTQIGAVAVGTFGGVCVVGWRVLAWLKRNARAIVADAMAAEVDNKIGEHQRTCSNYTRRRRAEDTKP